MKTAALACGACVVAALGMGVLGMGMFDGMDLSAQQALASEAGTMDTKDGNFSYNYAWDVETTVATVDGSTRTLHHLFVTNLFDKPTDVSAGYYATGFILTNGNHCVYWAGRTTGNSIEIRYFWYVENGVRFPVSVTSYDVDGFHWFGFDPIGGNFRIS